ncbi:MULTISPECIES: SDR family oxidoreductase [unclassified Pseudomonas]|uniref:SDR family NAD(P)-dependent oxidoreductase n=1 Tax=unclassified Pseudomonas TaxID=196821 RepID=UPI00088E1939|nr:MULTISPECIES: SDR family NAD(P)-dependent oxidoreductase [unclassified Pseudomonas]SCZ07087.1 Short-chain dehydrogenase [Pseudomonas sp. NFACC37-1]SFO76738.1 Short-chain dehydrogenase [Pseudomonas sp. NFACC24-1]
MSRIWLTGASSGIGAALAAQLLEQGHHLALSARQAEPLQALAARYPDQVLALPGDLTDPRQVALVCQQIEREWLTLDVVILNAGTCEYLESGHFDTHLVERVITTNLLGTSHCLEAALPLLRRGQRPHLVVVGSAVTWLALPRAGAYGASKAALRYLVESLRIDLAAEGIDVTLVSPGFVDTPLTRRNDFPMPMRWSAQRAARHIARRLPARPLDIAFPWAFTAVLRLLGQLPARWRLALGRRLARPNKES